MSQWVKVKSGYINLAQATDIQVAYSKDPGIGGVIKVWVYRLGEALWVGQSERPDDYDFDPEGMRNVVLVAGGLFGNSHGPVWIPAQD